jgi:hypothetical protein
LSALTLSFIDVYQVQQALPRLHKITQFDHALVAGASQRGALIYVLLN